jgi:16S rRNA A1518/A1519 N6-dimethyltransferase RsmA/KsgA/DIM1 with predicted DNA glycosylase/AP lyase activity
VIKAGFKERRKMLRNNLSFTKFSQEAILAVFERLDIAPSARAENLPLSTFAMLSDALLELRNAGKQDY